jgi:3-oxoacyl-[acyl-carrier protein] reductase
MHLADAGASVVVNYSSSKEGADRVVADITRIERLFAETKTAFGRVDILVNNAGVFEFKPSQK